MADMPVLQLLRLYQSLSRLQHFKNEKIMNDLRKATIGKQIGAGVGNDDSKAYQDIDSEDLKAKPEESGFFTDSDNETHFDAY